MQLFFNVRKVFEGFSSSLIALVVEFFLTIAFGFTTSINSFLFSSVSSFKVDKSSVSEVVSSTVSSSNTGVESNASFSSTTGVVSNTAFSSTAGVVSNTAFSSITGVESIIVVSLISWLEFSKVSSFWIESSTLTDFFVKVEVFLEVLKDFFFEVSLVFFFAPAFFLDDSDKLFAKSTISFVTLADLGFVEAVDFLVVLFLAVDFLVVDVDLEVVGLTSSTFGSGVISATFLEVFDFLVEAFSTIFSSLGSIASSTWTEDFSVIFF